MRFLHLDGLVCFFVKYFKNESRNYLRKISIQWVLECSKAKARDSSYQYSYPSKNECGTFNILVPNQVLCKGTGHYS